MGARFAGEGSMHHVAALSGVADAQLAIGDAEEAEATAKLALAAAENRLGSQHPGAAAPRLSLVRVYLHGGRIEPARALLDQVDAIAAGAGPAGQRIAAQASTLRERLSPGLRPAPATATPAP